MMIGVGEEERHVNDDEGDYMFITSNSPGPWTQKEKANKIIFVVAGTRKAVHLTMQLAAKNQEMRSVDSWQRIRTAMTTRKLRCEICTAVPF